MKGFVTYSNSLLLAIVLIATHGAGAAEDPTNKLAGVLMGPGLAKMETCAEVKVPEGFVFLDGARTRAMLRQAGQPVSGQELGYLEPTNGNWSVYFEFNEVGYIKDAEKEILKPAEILETIKRGTEASNEERAKNGVAPLHVVGWEKEPTFDPATKNLEWCLRARSGDRDILNYNTRLLGRSGVMEVVLVVGPDELQATLPQFREVIAGHQFQTGQAYAEYRQGDKLAKYGLAALVVGGAGFGAMKLGLLAWLGMFFKKFAKIIIVGVIAIAAAFKKFFGRLLGFRGNDSIPGA